MPGSKSSKVIVKVPSEFVTARVCEVPESTGSYYLTRAVDQAYWAVINGDSNVKDALVKWSRVADREIQRKIDEYSGQGG